MIIFESPEAFQDCMVVCDMNESFYYADQERMGRHFRIFNYRFARWDDWQINPITFHMRGLMYEITESGEFIRLACKPFRKFFNIDECPETQNLDVTLENIESIQEKLDGSLISTYTIDDQVCFKSKGSLHSTQAMAAESFFENLPNSSYKRLVLDISRRGGTINMEWCAPDNRIVVAYANPSLKILSCRFAGTEAADVTGTWMRCYMDHLMIQETAKFVPPFDLATVASMRGIEGFVIQLKTGQKFKLKTDQYKELHSAKDSISNPKQVATLVFSESLDDIKSMFHDDPITLAQIEHVENLVILKYRELDNLLRDFHAQNKKLSRKDYAILVLSSEVTKPLLGLLMNLYVDKEIDIGAYVIKYFDSVMGVISYHLEGTGS